MKKKRGEIHNQFKINELEDGKQIHDFELEFEEYQQIIEAEVQNEVDKNKEYFAQSFFSSISTKNQKVLIKASLNNGTFEIKNKKSNPKKILKSFSALLKLFKFICFFFN
jgi:hypothetical protein